MLKKIFSITAYLFLFIFVTNISAQSDNSGKKNARPQDSSAEKEKTAVKTTETSGKAEIYSYEFSQPQFVVSHIRIEHDRNGKGKITLGKKDFDEEYTDPLQLSKATMERLNTLWDALDFLDSNENYQSEVRDYGHLGNISLNLKAGDKERTAKFNWSENADAQALAQEYKKIANQFGWMFDIEVSRQNQPLESSRIMKSLDMMLKRNDISDPQQLLPFLKNLGEDERVPLITRNYALRLVKEIEKKNK